jgi:hypothetical protein
MAGPPFVTDDPEPVDAGHWELNVGLAGTLVRGRSRSLQGDG